MECSNLHCYDQCFFIEGKEELDHCLKHLTIQDLNKHEEVIGILLDEIQSEYRSEIRYLEDKIDELRQDIRYLESSKFYE